MSNLDTLCFCAPFVGLIIILVICSINKDIKKYREEFDKQKREYNNRHCTKCGIRYKLTKTRYNERIYVCPKCFNTVVISFYDVDSTFGKEEENEAD